MGDDTIAAKDMAEQAVVETSTHETTPSPHDAERQVALRCDASSDKTCDASSDKTCDASSDKTCDASSDKTCDARSDKTCDANVPPAKVRAVKSEANIDVPSVTDPRCVISVTDSHTPCLPRVENCHAEGESVSLHSVSNLASCRSERDGKIIRSDPVSTCRSERDGKIIRSDPVSTCRSERDGKIIRSDPVSTCRSERDGKIIRSDPVSTCRSERDGKIIRSDPVSTCLGGDSENNGSDEMLCQCDSSVSHILSESCADVSCTPDSKSNSEVAGNNHKAVSNISASVCQTSLQDCPGSSLTDRHTEPAPSAERLVERPKPVTDTSQTTDTSRTTDNDGKDLAYRKTEKRKRGSCRQCSAEGCVSNEPAKRKRHVPPTADSSSHTLRKLTSESATENSVVRSQNIPALNNQALSATSERREDAREMSTEQKGDSTQGDLHGEQQASESLTQPGETDRLKCQLCGYVFTREHNLARHVKKIHKTAYRELDPSALDFLLRFRGLAKHSLPCTVCGTHFSQPTELARHVKLTHRKKKVVKHDQPETQPPVKSRHPQWLHINKKPFGCSICDRSFMSAAYLSRHKKLVHRNGLGADHASLTPQPEVESRSEPGSVESRCEPGSVKRLDCRKCGESFSKAADFARHVKHTHRRRRVADRKVLKFRSVLKKGGGMRLVMSVKPFGCRQCGASFCEAVNLSRHVKLAHRGAPPAARSCSLPQGGDEKTGIVVCTETTEHSRPLPQGDKGGKKDRKDKEKQVAAVSYRSTQSTDHSRPLPQADKEGKKDRKDKEKQVAAVSYRSTQSTDHSCPLPQADKDKEKQFADDPYSCGLSLSDEVGLETHVKTVCGPNETTSHGTDRSTLLPEPAAWTSQPHSEGAVSLKISRKMLHVNQAESDEGGAVLQGNSSSQTGPKLEEDTVKYCSSKQDQVSNGRKHRLKALTDTLESSTDGEDIPRPPCTEKFTKQRKLKRHMFFTHNPQKSSAFKIRRKLVCCFQCPAKFTTPLSLTRHMLMAHRTHKTSSSNTRNSISRLEVEPVASKTPSHSEKNFPFFCPVCAKPFSSVNSLERHKSNVKPCVKRRERNSVLVASSSKHRQTQNHTDTDHDRNLSCRECGVSLSTLHNLRRHVSQIHNHHRKRTSGGASVSKRTARSKWTAKRKNVVWECDKCGGNFSTEYNLKRHVANLHSQQQSQPEPSVDTLNLPRPEDSTGAIYTDIAEPSLLQTAVQQEGTTSESLLDTHGPDKAVSPTAIQEADNAVSPTAIQEADNAVSPTAIQEADKAVCPTAIQEADKAVCPTAIQEADKAVSPTAIQEADKAVCPTAIQEADKAVCPTAIQEADKAVCPTAIQEADKAVCPTAIQEADKAVCPTAIQEADKADGRAVIFEPSLDDDRTGSVQILVKKGHLFLSSAAERQQSNTKRVREETSSQPGVPTVGVDHNENLQLTADDHNQNVRCKPEEKFGIIGSAAEPERLSQIKDEERITSDQAVLAVSLSSTGRDQSFTGVKTEKTIASVMPTDNRTADHKTEKNIGSVMPTDTSAAEHKTEKNIASVMPTDNRTADHKTKKNIASVMPTDTGAADHKTKKNIASVMPTDNRTADHKTEQNILTSVMPTDTSAAGHSQDFRLAQDKTYATLGSEADPNTSKQGITKEESLCIDREDSVKDTATGISLPITPCRVVLVDIRFAVNRLQTMGK